MTEARNKYSDIQLSSSPEDCIPVTEAYIAQVAEQVDEPMATHPEPIGSVQLSQSARKFIFHHGKDGLIYILDPPELLPEDT